jgi:hypothetical protein
MQNLDRRLYVSDSTIPSVSLSLPANDPRPLPEIIASKYEFALAFHEDADGNPSHRWYSVQDWVAGVSKSNSPRRFWFGIKRRLKNMPPNLKKLPYRSTDSKIYKMDFAQAETLYLITQRMSINSGIRNSVMLYLAKAGVVLDEFRRNPNEIEEVDFAGYFRLPPPQLSFPRYVYLFKREDLYKIGIAKAPDIRSQGIQSQSGLAHELVCSQAYENTFAQQLEKELHRKYDHVRVRGEWFRLNESELHEVIEAIMKSQPKM